MCAASSEAGHILASEAAASLEAAHKDSIAQYLKKLLEDIYNIHILYSQSYSNSGELLSEATPKKL